MSADIPPPASSGDNDEWYASEESTRAAMVRELQRIRRRARIRPWPVLALALVVTVAITFQVATRAPTHRAEIVLALREGSLLAANKSVGLPLGELRELVTSVLLPDARLAELIERRDLHRLRSTLGMPWAISELRQSVEIEIWRNSFVYYDPELPHREASARVGLSVVDEDPDRALALAHDLAAIVISEVRTHRLALTRRVAREIAALRTGMSERMDTLERERTERMVAHARAVSARKHGLAQTHRLRLTEIDSEQKDVEKTLSTILTSQDAIADRIAEAGLDLVVEVVSERRPARPEHRGLLLAIVATIVGVGSLLGAALVLGAFDSRVHDIEDIARLGLPVLGHVPGFPGSEIGALEARGVQRPAVPTFSRWRSNR